MAAKPIGLGDLERALGSGEGPSAIALLGSDGYLVSEARQGLVKILEQRGEDVRSADDLTPIELADELRTGGLFAASTTFVLDDPEWLAPKGDDTKRLLALAKAIQDGKGRPERRLVESLVARGVTWSPEAPAAARTALEAWLKSAKADAEASAICRAALDRAASERIEAAGGDPAEALRAGLEHLAPGNRLIVALSSIPKSPSPFAALKDHFTAVMVSLGEGDVSKALAQVARAAAADVGVKIDARALELLLARTAAGGSGEGGSIRLFRSELDKLLSSAGRGGAVNEALVETLVQDASAVGPSWEIDPELQARNAKGAIEIARRLMGRGKDGEPMKLLGYIAGRYRQMLRIERALGDDLARAGKSSYPNWQSSVAPRLSHLLEKGKKEYPLYKATLAAAAYSRRELEGALRRLARIDQSVKSGGPPLPGQIEGFLLRTLPRLGARR